MIIKIYIYWHVSLCLKRTKVPESWPQWNLLSGSTSIFVREMLMLILDVFTMLPFSKLRLKHTCPKPTSKVHMVS